MMRKPTVFAAAFFFTLALFCRWSLPPTAAEEDKRSLDAQLLDDLDSELLQDLPPAPPKIDPPPDQSPPAAESEADPTNDGQEDKREPKLDQAGVGEDVELGQAADPLTRIGRRMRTAKDLIDRRNTSTQTQRLQQEILDDLSALIAKLQAQQARQNNSNQSDMASGQFRPGAGEGSGDAQMDQGPEKSTDRVGQADTTLTALQRQQELLRRMNWGSLPDRWRDEVRSTRAEQFLPKYATLIEQYYKRLAEELQFQP